MHDIRAFIVGPLIICILDFDPNIKPEIVALESTTYLYLKHRKRTHVYCRFFVDVQFKAPFRTHLLFLIRPIISDQFMTTFFF